MSCSELGPGTTATSSQPSSPQLSSICLVACTSSGTVAYSHLGMHRTLRFPGNPGSLGSLADPLSVGVGDLRYLGYAFHRRDLRFVQVWHQDRRDGRLSFGDLGVA